MTTTTTPFYPKLDTYIVHSARVLKNKNNEHTKYVIIATYRMNSNGTYKLFIAKGYKGVSDFYHRSHKNALAYVITDDNKSICCEDITMYFENEFSIALNDKTEAEAFEVALKNTRNHFFKK